jgi:hypothetical protein
LRLETIHCRWAHHWTLLHFSAAKSPSRTKERLTQTCGGWVALLAANGDPLVRSCIASVLLLLRALVTRIHHCSRRHIFPGHAACTALSPVPLQSACCSSSSRHRGHPVRPTIAAAPTTTTAAADGIITGRTAPAWGLASGPRHVVHAGGVADAPGAWLLDRRGCEHEPTSPGANIWRGGCVVVPAERVCEKNG